jgi:hypothetical protein
MLQKAVDKTQKDFLLEDILGFLIAQDMQLWVWVEDNDIVACCITQIINYPRRSVCTLPYIAGSGMRRFLQCEDQIIAWAKERGCTQLEGFDRGGWLRVLKLKNWFRAWTVIRKDI